MLVDSHCHLNSKDFTGELDQVIKNSEKAGLKYLHTICTKLEDIPEIKEIIKKYSNIFASIGIHPHEAELCSQVNTKMLIDLVNSHPKFISFGETGLDYFYEYSNRTIQKQMFVEHIQASQITNLPLVVHMRSAEKDACEIMYSEYQNSPFTGVIHCFTASKDFAYKMMDLGFYISVSGIITFKNADELRQTIACIPLDRLLVETDAPYLSPTPLRSKRNEPAYITHTVQILAQLKNILPKKIVEITGENFLKLFSKVVK